MKAKVSFLPDIKLGDTISKEEFLKALFQNLEGVEFIGYVPEDPDDFHTDYILEPVVPKKEPVYAYQYKIRHAFNPVYEGFTPHLTDEEYKSYPHAKSKLYEKDESSKLLRE